MQETQKGTLYVINYDTIVSDIKALNEERNTVERLRLADTIRIEKGLEPINTAKIKAFADTSFDTDIQLSNRCEEATEAKETATERAAKAIPKATEQTGVTDKATSGIPTNTHQPTVTNTLHQPRIDPAKFTREEWIKLINYYIVRGENRFISFYESDIKVNKVLGYAKQYGHIIEVPRNAKNHYTQIAI